MTGIERPVGAYTRLVLSDLRPAVRAYTQAQAKYRRAFEAMHDAADAGGSSASFKRVQDSFGMAADKAIVLGNALADALARAWDAFFEADEAERDATRQACIDDLEPGPCAVILNTGAPASMRDWAVDGPEYHAIEALAVAVCGWDLNASHGLLIVERLAELGPQVMLSGVSFQAALDVKGEFTKLGLSARIREGSPPRATRDVASRAPISEAVRHEVWRRDEGRCVDCGSRDRLEFDHIIPHSKGGSNTVRNIELRCEECNRSKGARI